jgi:hypothetical protein
MKQIDHIDPSVYERVQAMPGVRVYHLRPWHDFLRQAFGWEVHALVEEGAAGELKFYLPFVSKRGTNLKSSRVALPLSHHVAPLGELSEIPEGLEPVQVHGDNPTCPGPLDESRVVTELDLSVFETDGDVFKQFSKSSMQRKIKKAEKSGYGLSRETNAKTLNAFTSMQAETRRRQGSPTFPAKFFPLMAECLGEAFHIHSALNAEGEVVASIIFIDDGDTTIYGYGASLDRREIWQDGVNQLVMWDAIRAAYARGRTLVDFGTSPLLQPNLIQYKEKWGGVSRSMPYTSMGGTGAGGIERESAAVKLVSAVLKRTPMPIFKQISPILLKLAA